MKLSTRGRYGARALLDIALHQGDEPIPLKDVALRQQISLRYLNHLITPLVAAGILRSARGTGGGVRLAKRPDEIKLSEVMQLLEGSIALVDCVDDPDMCTRSGICAARDLWEELKQAMSGILESMTLQDLVERQKAKEPCGEAMYQM
ncbi:MAG TPA: Rrf2 family transcriptional regulator [Dehalococcoidia bacterium]|nr:Rrf2 family transcriptional regulator [Dehalococcoidia bacterium]